LQLKSLLLQLQRLVIVFSF